MRRAVTLIAMVVLSIAVWGLAIVGTVALYERIGLLGILS